MKQEIQIDIRFTGEVPLEPNTDPMIFAQELRQALNEFLKEGNHDITFTLTTAPVILDVKEEAQIYGNDDEPDEDE